MKCPACDGVLSEISLGDLNVDACKEGCAGVWFDLGELKKVDESNESAGAELLSMPVRKPAPPATAAHRACPHCETRPMARHYFSVKQTVEIDECAACGGVWLDTGELAAIRRASLTEAQRKQAAIDFFDKLFSEPWKAAEQQRDQSSQKAVKFARAFRFVLPSYWIPGKQPWGAF